ncbi:MAG: hypothetical protein ACE5G7_01960 [Candidatus Hydrothermarchaeaceae archaeon]
MSQIKEPLRKGAIAKLYLLVYPREIHGYELAKQEYLKIDKSYYSKMGSRYKELFHTKIVIVNGRSRKYYKSRAQPLLDQTKASLREKGIHLTNPEENTLFEFLDGPFRRLINIDYALEEPSPLSYFYNELGLNALAHLQEKENPERLKEGETQLNQAYEKLGKRLLEKLAKLPSPYLLNLIDKTLR